MRLGLYPCQLADGSRAKEAYGEEEIRERHRHRLEFNNVYRERLREAGLSLTGICPENDLVEIIELPDHPWFVGVQFHPELRSRPRRPHPLFREFVKAAVTAKENWRLVADRARFLGRPLPADRLFVIAGPCVIEGEAMTLDVAAKLKEICARLSVDLVFKSSYRKDNRTAIDSFTGPEIDEGLRILARVRDELGVPVLTDVHCRLEVGPASAVATVLQIPAFLCRQTRLMQEAARDGVCGEREEGAVPGTRRHRAGAREAAGRAARRRVLADGTGNELRLS